MDSHIEDNNLYLRRFLNLWFDKYKREIWSKYYEKNIKTRIYDNTTLKKLNQFRGTGTDVFRKGLYNLNIR